MRSNLLRLSAIRALVLGGQLLALGYFTLRQPLGLPVLELSLLLALFTLLTAQGWLRQRVAAISAREFFANLLLDTLIFSLLLYYSGGSSNPFISYYLIPITIAAITLPGRLAAAITVTALLSYTLLLEWHVPIAALSLSAHAGHGGASDGANLHIIGMWVNFALSASIIGYYISRMASTVRAQQQRLERQRADQLRSDQLNAIGLLAAGTAHELGTPLNTMKIVLDELCAAPPQQAGEDLQLLNSQVQHCQTILRSLVDTARQATEPDAQQVVVAAQLGKLIERWQLLRPRVAVVLQQQIDSGQQGYLHPSVEQAFINLLNNAADASAERIEVTTAVDGDMLRFAVRDYGAGIELATAVGNRAPSGLGIGLALTRATLERFGGALQLQPHPAGGSLATATVSLQRVAP